MIRLPERQLETKYDLCLEQICSQDGELACWDSGVFSFLRPGWFGQNTALLLLLPFAWRVTPVCLVTTPSHNEWIVECFLFGSDLKVFAIFFPNSRPFYTKSSACYVMVLSCDGTWNEATLLVELTPLCNCLKVRRAWQRERATERAQHVMQVSLLQPKIFRIFYLSG